MMAALLILWFIATVANGIAAPIVGTIRWGLKGFGSGCVVVFGWLCTGCFLMAAIGVMERTWSVSSMQTLLCAFIGLAGILMIWWGWRRILQRRFGPGQCAGCGYALVGLRDCPECGLREAGTHAPIVD
ncbi:MAG: hypothetical protein NTV94_11570 [Planctomycetota bacterium]|nr:hypothetical protein [Planctomycetota bacterium]